MKFIVALLLTALLSFAIGLAGSLPWWSFAVCAFIVALAIHQKGWKAFLSAFLGVSLLWAALAAYYDLRNEHLLSARIAALLSIGSSVLLIIITALVGGLVGGFAALTGSYLRKK
jgi:hypothetical protein